MRRSSKLSGNRQRLEAVALLLIVLWIAGPGASSGAARKSVAEDLNGKPVDPLASSGGHVVVLLFLRTDCPISNRYAPAVEHLSEQYRGKVNFWLVYPDPAESPAQIRTHLRDFRYSIPALRDTRHELVKVAQATITPEAAVFNSSSALVYHGRIDNRYEEFGRSRPSPTTHELAEAILATLNGKPVNPDHANAVGCYISDLR